VDSIIYILKAHLLFIILGSFFHFFLRKEKNFHFNRFYLLGAYFISIIAPFLEFNIFNTVIIIDTSIVENSINDSKIIQESVGNAGNSLNLYQILKYVYLTLCIGSVSIFIIRFIKSYSQFNLVIRNSKFDYRSKVYWVEKDIPALTFITKTLLPLKLQNNQEKDIIIKHEESHRKGLHFIDIFCIELCSSILILNPLNRLIKRYVVENHEYIADHYASKATEKNNYVNLLIRETVNNNSFKLASFFAKPSILNRLDMLKNNNTSSNKTIVAALLFFITSFIFSCNFNQNEEIVLAKDINTATVEEAIQITDKIFNVVEKQAEPKNGIQEFYNQLSEEMEGLYPEEAIENKIEGVVYLQFIIEKDGSFSNIQAVKGIGYGCDELAIEVLKKQGKWNPAKQNGKAVRSRRVIPIRFQINS